MARVAARTCRKCAMRIATWNVNSIKQLLDLSWPGLRNASRTWPACRKPMHRRGLPSSSGLPIMLENGRTTIELVGQ
jgi:hypothetical protein